ncbi:hypothetical protein DERP_003553 [Dermatophagoides pteronyssinus]|uniref:Uncharacterized protein n=1 Tax=Dermatophagoides pteronyssinus TaxID=6956 RepID=A0ABQ8JKY7_DERPT|nr:hypothetical protein DERP_003553 [Dermatophagoides pteronyssinus]
MINPVAHIINMFMLLFRPSTKQKNLNYVTFHSDSSVLQSKSFLLLLSIIRMSSAITELLRNE